MTWHGSNGWSGACRRWRHRDPVGIVLGITQGGIACLQVADCLRIRPSRVYIPGEESVAITRQFEALRRCRSGRFGERKAQKPRKARTLAPDVRMSDPLPTDRPTFAKD